MRPIGPSATGAGPRTEGARKSDEEKAAKQEKDAAFRDFVQARDRKARDEAEARGKEAKRRLDEAKRR